LRMGWNSRVFSERSFKSIARLNTLEQSWGFDNGF
jgi:hypothetical protein